MVSAAVPPPACLSSRILAEASGPFDCPVGGHHPVGRANGRCSSCHGKRHGGWLGGRPVCRRASLCRLQLPTEPTRPGSAGAVNPVDPLLCPHTDPRPPPAGSDLDPGSRDSAAPQDDIPDDDLLLSLPRSLVIRRHRARPDPCKCRRGVVGFGRVLLEGPQGPRRHRRLLQSPLAHHKRPPVL